MVRLGQTKTASVNIINKRLPSRPWWPRMRISCLLAQEWRLSFLCLHISSWFVSRLLLVASRGLHDVLDHYDEIFCGVCPSFSRAGGGGTFSLYYTHKRAKLKTVFPKILTQFDNGFSRLRETAWCGLGYNFCRHRFVSSAPECSSALVLTFIPSRLLLKVEDVSENKLFYLYTWSVYVLCYFKIHGM
jgi:hypothetical protein